MSEELKDKKVSIGFMDDIIPILQASKMGKLPNGEMTFGVNLDAIAHKYLMHTAITLAENINDLSKVVAEIDENEILRDSEKLHRIKVLIQEAVNTAAKNLESLIPKKQPEPSKIVGLDGKGL